jgi:F420-dependent oxidoreductase-like protein
LFDVTDYRRYIVEFGAFVPQGWRMDLVGIDPADHWETITGVASRIERAGYRSLWVYDHFHTVPEASQEATYEAFTLLAALAGVTSRVRLGQMCTCHAYRPPAMLAKISANIDVISGGRLDLGIGAGWYREEFDAYNFAFPKGSVRIAELREAVEIIEKMWTEDEVYYDGAYYSVNGAINRPRPLQSPRPPIWIAGGGEKLTLRLVAEKADYANFAASPQTFVRKSEILDGHCRDVGRDPADIIRSVHLEVLVGETEDDVRAIAERGGSQRSMSGEEYASRFTVGTAEQVSERLAEYAEAGCGYVVAYFPDSVWGTSLELFAEHVMPNFIT